MADRDLVPYLIGLDLRGRCVVVVGGGSVAQRRLTRLTEVGAVVTVIAPVVTPAVEAMAAAGAITLVQRAFAPGDLVDAWYVLAATNSGEVNAAVISEATAARIFAVRADDAAGGTAVTPAGADHGDLTIGVLARGDHRRSAAVRSAIIDSLRDGTLPAAAAPHPAGVALVGGGPGDPELLTVRGRRLLSVADVVVTDRLGPAGALHDLAPHVEVIDASKIPYGRFMAQEAINETLIAHAKAGKFVVRLKGGDPYVFGRGFEEVQALTAAGIAVTVVPGISSAIAVPAAAGIPVSHRGVAHEITIVSGHLAPGHPDSLVNWQALGATTGTLVLLMAVGRLTEFADVLMAAGRAADTPVMIIEQGTTPLHRQVRSTLATLAADAAAAACVPPAIVVIGPVAGLTAAG